MKSDAAAVLTRTVNRQKQLTVFMDCVRYDSMNFANASNNKPNRCVKRHKNKKRRHPSIDSPQLYAWDEQLCDSSVDYG